MNLDIKSNFYHHHHLLHIYIMDFYIFYGITPKIFVSEQEQLENVLEKLNFPMSFDMTIFIILLSMLFYCKEKYLDKSRNRSTLNIVVCTHATYVYTN